MGNGPTVELTIQTGGHTETYTVQTANRTPGDLIGALATVCGAAFGAHRAELRELAAMVGKVLQMTGLAPAPPHGLAMCPNIVTCPYHMDVPRDGTLRQVGQTLQLMSEARVLVIELLLGVEADKLRGIIDTAAGWPESGPPKAGRTIAPQLRERTLDGRGEYRLWPSIDVVPHTLAECNGVKCPWHEPLPWYRGHAGGTSCTDVDCGESVHYAFGEPPF